MQEGVSNPALGLRASVEALGLPGMLRWDATGRALLVSDAPRHAGGCDWAGTLQGKDLRVQVHNRLLWLDLPMSAYQRLLPLDFMQRGPWHATWFEEQALLGGILTRTKPTPAEKEGQVDEAVLRGTMLACAQGERRVRSFMDVLRAVDAEALRKKRVASTRAAAALCSAWLWTSHCVGLPEMGHFR